MGRHAEASEELDRHHEVLAGPVPGHGPMPALPPGRRADGSR